MTHRSFRSLAHAALAVVVLFAFAFAFAAFAVTPAKPKPGQTAAVVEQVHAPPVSEVATMAQAFTFEKSEAFVFVTPQTVASIEPTATNTSGTARAAPNDRGATGETNKRPAPATVLRS
jgi:hypothetical protein